LNFDGNKDGRRRHARAQMKSTKAHGMLSWITGKGTYNESKFDEDAEKIIEYYRNKGYIRRASASPRSRRSKTAKTRKRAGSS
jgi:outer membrane protein assembly factor BamA